MQAPGQRTGIANLPLHGGQAPPWLFQRMARLAREVAAAIIVEHGRDEMLRRLSDPYWFQAFGCVLGFDWHSSGVTTTVCGALRAGLRGTEKELGLFVAGGKGRAALHTPTDIEMAGASLAVSPSGLVYASRMSAKVDNVALQDGYSLYHHSFFFTSEGKWAVVQQGMNSTLRYARRYHWLGERVTDFTNEPQSAICSESHGASLNLVATESAPARSAIGAMTGTGEAQRLISELKTVTLTMPRREYITARDINVSRIARSLESAVELRPATFEALLALNGVGPKTVRALALLSDIVYGAPPSLRDPATFSFAHGGKDGHPFPVDRTLYDKSIEMLAQAVRSAKVGDRDRMDALRRLGSRTRGAP
jgi:hypothetical protein